ncbi:MAG TPA: hypothetical protein VIM65_23055 [Cyclobacteriaceae bacterium]
MKKVFSQLLIGSIFLLVSISCKESIDTKEFSVLQAKAWFETYLSEDSLGAQSLNGYQNSSGYSTSLIKKEIFWSKAKKISVEEFTDTYAIPMWYESKYRFGKQTIRELWITKDVKGKMKALIVEILATNENFSKNNYKLDMSNFTGGITIHDWKTGFQGGLYYVNGVRVGFINDYQVTNVLPKPNITTSQRTADCGYQYSYVSNGQFYVVWVYQSCMTYWSMVYSQNLAAWSAQSWVDSQYGCEVSSTCQSGDTYPQPYYEPIPDDYIYNNTYSDCIRHVTDNLINSDLRNDVNTMINTGFGMTSSTNLTLEEDESLTVPGRTVVTNDSNPLNVTIYLDTDLKSSSSEYVASVVYHEAIHAYLNANNYSRDQLEQHVEIAENYINQLSKAILEVFPNLAVKDCNGLALRGLKDIMTSNPTYFNDLIHKYNFSSVEEITSLTDGYRNGTKGTACK